ncbi:YhgE/Pip domain-containing protein [Bacillus cereus group sp. BfR-BA-01380]|uniref:YhgE/Pip domain-containing protein n=1 Tax=Bacillus cereus group sp. BfR-BA-01380 TaxID=2920324 RepID=UPI001F58D92C|nr:YhgE/Pip domain-containing protein [Bacillus cereus group sp. BfR-BA-01380]
MRGLKLLGQEFATIIKSKKLLIPIIAVLFIPVLYAGMFLGAFWDPYKQLDDLPVAVVNLDEGAVYNGKPIEAGKELVTKLKEKKGFKWEFVSEKTAKKGMDDRKYYMTVRIPNNFSKNTTTLLDAHPKKSTIEYIPNESLNFLSSQIGGSAIEKIKSEVSATVTKTYAETMFDSLKDVSKGFADASEGAGKIHDGTGKLKDGSQQITNGLGELSGKANDGLNKLADGSGQLTGGLGQLVDSKGKFQNGLNQLSNGSGQLTGGLGQLADSKGKFQNGLGQLANGSNQITNGLGELNSKVSGMPGGVNQLLGGSQQITGGLNELINPKGKLQSSLGQLLDGSQQITGGLKQYTNPQGDYQSGLKAAKNGAQEVSGGAAELSQGVSKWKEKADKLSAGADTTAGGAKVVADGLAALNGKLKDLPEEDKKQLQQLIAVSQKVAAGTSDVAQGVQGLAGEKGAEKIEAGATKLASGAGDLNKGINQLSEKSIAGLNKLANGSGQVTGGLGQLVDSKGEFQTGLNKLANGSGQITGGLNTLADSAGPLASGVNALYAGSQQITGGLGQFVDPKGELQTNLGKLLNGSQQITGGLGQFVDPKGELQTNLGKLLNGSQQITGGLGQFVDPKGDFQSGLTRLQDGSGQVTNGLGEANNGSKELATKLGEGAEKTSETKGDENKYDMFASPVKVKTEKMAEVPNYGTGFTPYFLSLGLFVGALLLSIVFPLRETVGTPKSGFSWFISKFGVLLAVGVIQALVADAVLLLWLGVNVQSVPYFVLFSIITSLSFIALVQFLVTTFGDAGRFIAILTLILQLTTSAGTFPLELIPKPMQALNAWFPMTYSVSGLKAVVSSGDFGFMWQNAGMLMIFIVLLSLGTIGTLTWMHKRQYGGFSETE